MFTLVNYVRLSQGYIRGQFVLKQWQFLIGRAARVQIKWSLSLWFVISVRVICLLCFVNSEITTWLHLKSDFDCYKSEDQSSSSFLSTNFQKIFGHIRLFAFSDSLLFQDLWVAKSNSFKKNQWLLELSLYYFDFRFDKY